MPSALARERGSATAEWAIALPAVVLVLAAVLASVGTVMAQARVDTAAAEAARLATLGHSESSVARHAASLLESFVDVATTSATRGPSVCVTVQAHHHPRPIALEPLQLQATACALDEATP